MQTGLKIVAVTAMVVAVSGCASGLNSMQEREYVSMQSDNVLVEEKSPAAGAWLGLLPGGGSFYSRHIGLGILNLCLWPLSILWDPISGYDGAQVINYDITKHTLKKKLRKEEEELDGKLTAGEIDQKQYVTAKHKLSAKYDYE